MTKVSQTVADRLRRARGRRFVGRHAERALFREAVTADEPAFTVLYIYGPGGVGKSALLTAFGDIVSDAGDSPLRVDARTVEPVPAAFRAVVGAVLAGDCRVLLLDTFEVLAPLDGWLREEFLPSLPASALVVIASRQPPSVEWLTDPGWRELLRVLSLRNLPPADARAVLQSAGVPADLHDQIVAATYGHPLALALSVDVLAQRPQQVSFDLAPDVVRALVGRFVQDSPSARHREAVEVCAHAMFTTESMLAAALGGEDIAELFGWLRGLSFIEENAQGVFPHDVARDSLDTDLRWRDPHRYADLHRRIRAEVISRIERSPGDSQRIVQELVFLHRRNPGVRDYWDWASIGQGYIDELRAGDREVVIDMTARHQGAVQARLVEHWLDHQPQGFVVFRSSGRDIVGYACGLALNEASAAELQVDPGAQAMWKYVLAHGPPRPGEVVFAGRFFMDATEHQRPSLSQNLISVHHVQELFRHTRRAWDLIGVYQDGDFWEPFFTYMDFHRAHDAEYDIDGQHYAVFAHDWRRTGLADWLEMMGEREIGAEVSPPSAPAVELVLSQPDFASAVRSALRDIHRPSQLAMNPLVRSRLTRGAAEPLTRLVEELHDAAKELRSDPRDEKYYSALDRTYLRPAPTQERAAEVLGLPFSTYRRYLARGVERVTERLWQREIYG